MSILLRPQTHVTAPPSVASILLIGANGMLGRAWRDLLERSGIPYVAPNRDQLNLSNSDSLKRWLANRFEWVVNCAAYTNVDAAESDRVAAERINADACGFIAELCDWNDSKLLHYSTDYVFNGQEQKPYAVDHPVSPINHYGYSKALGEQRIVDSGCQHLIVRSSWLHAPHGRNFLRTMLQLMQSRDFVRVVTDQVGRPTCVHQLAKTSFALMQMDASGFFHIADRGTCSWYEFALAIRDASGLECDVQSCSTDEFRRAARRPAYSVLDLSRTESIVGELPHWKRTVEDSVRMQRNPSTSLSSPAPRPTVGQSISKG
ncbi:MAG: dTDP-4-dehydrorhamnose reductase [Planctomycetota bacterium]